MAAASDGGKLKEQLDAIKKLAEEEGLLDEEPLSAAQVLNSPKPKFKLPTDNRLICEFAQEVGRECAPFIERSRIHTNQRMN